MSGHRLDAADRLPLPLRQRRRANPVRGGMGAVEVPCVEVPLARRRTEGMRDGDDTIGKP
jgi:hypothetical protein